MILKKDIVLDSNPLLREKSVNVTLPLSDEDKKTLDSMIEYLENSQDEEKAIEYDLQPGVGIAAPQIGILKKYKEIEEKSFKMYSYIAQLFLKFPQQQ